jgi:hypothetical protein
MDTRDKILTLAAARRLDLPLTVIATASTILRAGLIDELAALRRPGRALLAVVLPAEPELLPRRARAELLAALRIVDYVTIADVPELDGLDAIHLESRDLELVRRVRGPVHYNTTIG